MPFFCYNKNDYCDHSENCDGCNVWVRGKGGKEVPSNSDRIRAMNDYELAVFLAKVKALVYRADLPVIAYSTQDMAENLEWLQQPAKEVHADG